MMTWALCYELYREWENDPAMMEHFVPYQYDEAAVDRYFDAKQEPSRVLFAIMKGERPIGELHLGLRESNSSRPTAALLAAFCPFLFTGPPAHLHRKKQKSTQYFSLWGAMQFLRCGFATRQGKRRRKYWAYLQGD